jgi:hypothetical protein
LKFSKNLNALGANHQNSWKLHGLETLSSKAYLPDFDLTIDHIVKLFTNCLGSSDMEHRRETPFSKLAHCEMTKEKIGWVQMLDSRDKLKTYVDNVIQTKELYSVPPSFSQHQVVDVDSVDIIATEGNEVASNEVEFDRIGNPNPICDS